MRLELLEDRRLLAAVRDGFNSFALAPNDDGSTGAVDIGFDVNFFGAVRSQLFVNNNGNVTFDEALADYTPSELNAIPREIIAPFWADVDTRSIGTVTYGTGAIDGRSAFGANWIDVGYFSENNDLTNSFQLVLINRSDIEPGAFDVEFNYDKIQWETGDADGGQDGLGGTGARAGFSNGNRSADASYELIGSGDSGTFLNGNTTTGLINNNLRTETLGRYVFEVRSGTALDEFGLTGQAIDLGGGVFFLGTGYDPSVFRPETTTNREAADTINVPQLRVGGTLGLNLDGTGITAGVWEAGGDNAYVLATHQEFGGRVTIVDDNGANPNNPSDHATGVAGTLGASGVNAAAQGMAPLVGIRSFNAANDDTELGANAAAIEVSNHSYSNFSGWSNRRQIDPLNVGGGLVVRQSWSGDYSTNTVEDEGFGKYNDDSRLFDQVLNIAANRHLLTVWAAGNDQGDDIAAGTITGATNANPIAISSNGHGLVNGDSVLISGVLGNTAANGTHIVTRIDANTFSVGTAGNGTYTGGGNFTTTRYVTHFSAGFAGGAAGWYLVPNAGTTIAPGPDGGATGFDTIPGGGGTAKNTLTVGASNALLADPLTPADVASLTLAGFTSLGPTDDGRIKPDVVANGTNIFTPESANNTDYGTTQGTSFSAPSVAGLAVLINQHFQNIHGTRPESATQKGLLIHTASDVGNPGPDYRSGWGLVNGERAAELLTLAAVPQGLEKHFVSERTLGNNGVDAIPFVVGAGGKLKATIAWSDPAGDANMGGVDDATRALVNDLDLTIRGPNGVFLPWTLDPADPDANATRNARNNLDNVEQVLIDAAVAGTYSIEISHTGAIQGGAQNFSLLISGRQVLPVLPVPTRVFLDPSFGDETVRLGSLTNGFPKLFISADVLGFVDTDLNGVVNGTELPILAPGVITPAPFVGTPEGVAVEVFHNGTSIGFATDLGTGTLFEFTPVLPLAGININDGDLHVFTAAVRLFDGTATPPVSVRSELSPPLNVITDEAPKLGVWSGGSVYLDLNGDEQFGNPNNLDVVHTLGLVTDHIFNGLFVSPLSVDLFDRLAVYGRVGGAYRWLIDFDNDGVPDNIFNEPADFNKQGIPVAGDFNGNFFDFDEIGLFTGAQWILDTKRTFSLADETPIPSEIHGLPVVGDFDGDGNDDLATYNPTTNTFFVSISPATGPDAKLTYSFRLGNGVPFLGVRERPVAADMNGDGVDDLGLWVPDRSGILPEKSAEWYFIVSPTVGGVGQPLRSRVVKDLTTGQDVINFRPRPFGSDLFYQFGDEYSLPLVGNFDPPGSLPAIPAIGGNETNTVGTTSSTNTTASTPDPVLPSVVNPLGSVTVSEDGSVSAIDLHSIFTGDGLLDFVIQSQTLTGILDAHIQDSSLTMTLRSDTTGSGEIVVRATDGLGNRVNDTLSVTVLPVNDGPVVIQQPETVTLFEDQDAVEIRLSSFFSDVDDSQLQFSVGASNEVSSWLNMQVVADRLRILPRSNRSGNGVVTISATDDDDVTAQVSVSITVTAVNDPPIAINQTSSIKLVEDQAAFTMDLNSAFDDVDDELLTYRITSNVDASLFDASINGQQIRLAPRMNATGSTTVVVDAADSGGAVASTTFAIDVAAVNDTPLILRSLPQQIFVEDGPATSIDLKTHFTDQDSDTLQFTIEMLSPDSVFNFAERNGILSIEPLPNRHGHQSFRITATDPSGRTVESSIEVTVLPQNDAPIFTAIETIQPIRSVADVRTIRLGSVFTDLDGDTLSYRIVSISNPSLISASIVGSDLMVSGLAGQTGTTVVSVIASDPYGSAVIGQFEFGIDVPATTIPTSDAMVESTESETEIVDVPPNASQQTVETITKWLHNLANPTDVDNDGQVIPRDVLLVINALIAEYSPELLPVSYRPASSMSVDVSGNGTLEALDALLIINELNHPNPQPSDATLATGETQIIQIIATPISQLRFVEKEVKRDPEPVVVVVEELKVARQPVTINSELVSSVSVIDSAFADLAKEDETDAVDVIAEPIVPTKRVAFHRFLAR